jgi:hypothetical protein
MGSIARDRRLLDTLVGYDRAPMTLAEKLYSGGALGVRLALLSCVYQVAVHAGLDDATRDQSSFLPHALALFLLGVLAPFVAREESPASIRLGALRALVAALLLGAVDAAVLAFCNEQIAIGYREWRPGTFVAGFGTGLLAGSMLLVEWLASRREASLRRDVDAASASFGLAFGGLWLLAVQFAYLHPLAHDASVPDALQSVSAFLPRTVELPVSCAHRIFHYAIPFALLVVARLRKLGLVAQLDLVVGVTTLLMVLWAFLKLGPLSEVLDYVGISFVFFPLRRGPLLLTAATLPIACQIAERLDLAITRRSQAETDQRLP